MDTPGKTNGFQPLRIAGIGWYIPKRTVLNEELERNFGCEPGWVSNHLGIERRFWAEEETPSQMGAAAAISALKQASIDAEDIDLIINASTTASYERILPEGGAMIQQRLELGESGIPAYSIQAGGMSFVAALKTAACLLAGGRYQVILVVCAELFSRNLDENDPAVYGRFADGAAAVVLTAPEKGESSGIHASILRTYGEGAGWLYSRMGLDAFRIQGLQPGDLAVQMDRESFDKHSAARSIEVIDELLSENTCSVDDISVFVPQQWDVNYLSALEERVPRERCVSIVGNYGYCGAASLPLAIYEALEKENLKRGHCFAVFGCDAGLTAGGVLMTY
jgi:3-oxoacyl-[acyl-carrier-protein] synthase-3